MNIYKTIIAVITTLALLVSTAGPANAEESIRKKAEFNQTIKKDRWVTLNFKGKDYIKGNGNRSLFCYQSAIKMKGKKKPKYVKIRLVRLKGGKNDSTATNTYYVGSKPKKTLVFSNCWVIKTNSSVAVQIKITGGSKSYRSDMRQFKMWTPGANYPADFSDFIPQGSL
jgi:hypothetical protein